MATSRDKIRDTISTWKIRGVIEKNQYDNEELSSFLLKYYVGESRKNKHAIGFYVKGGGLLEDFSIKKAIEADKKFRQGPMTEGTRRFRKQMTEIEIKELAEKQMMGRKTKYKSEGLTAEESIKKTYREGLLTKGRLTADFLGLDKAMLSKEELYKLSGFVKKSNFSKLSPEVKQEKRIIWKKNCLQNINIIALIKTEHRYYSYDDGWSDGEIEKWYSIYVSLMSTKSILNGRGKTSKKIRYKHGHYISTKTNVKNYYRSSLEEKALIFLDSAENIKYFKTEPYHLKYNRPNEEFTRRYVPDLLIIWNDNSKQLIEIKPRFMVDEFIKDKNQYLKEQITIITEKDLENIDAFITKLEEGKNESIK